MPFSTMVQVLDDLSSRFIINVPDEELASVERICFQIEQAHWFYEDFIREQNPTLASYSLKTFSSLFFRHCPLLHQWRDRHLEAYEYFLSYKFRVPVCGAILLNRSLTHCVLVKGWSSRAGWGFPRGKINKEEKDANCAIREVLEETGFDIEPLLDESHYVERTIRGQRVRLFVVPGVPDDAVFVPQTRKEISKVEWHSIASLPRQPKASIEDPKVANNKYYMVMPFIALLKQWIQENEERVKKKLLEDSRRYNFGGSSTSYSSSSNSPRNPSADPNGLAAELLIQLRSQEQSSFGGDRPLTPFSRLLKQLTKEKSEPPPAETPNRPLTPTSKLLRMLQDAEPVTHDPEAVRTTLESYFSAPTNNAELSFDGGVGNDRSSRLVSQLKAGELNTRRQPSPQRPQKPSTYPPRPVTPHSDLVEQLKFSRRLAAEPRAPTPREVVSAHLLQTIRPATPRRLAELAKNSATATAAPIISPKARYTTPSEQINIDRLEYASKGKDVLDELLSIESPQPVRSFVESRKSSLNKQSVTQSLLDVLNKPPPTYLSQF